LRRPLACLLVRRGEEEEFDAFALELVPVEGGDAEVVGVEQAGELWVQAGECHCAAIAFGAHAAEEYGRRDDKARVAQEQTREFAASVPADARDCGAEAFCWSCHLASLSAVEVVNAAISPLRIAKARCFGREDKRWSEVKAKRLGNVRLDPLLDCESFARVCADHQDGVVAGDGADDFGPLFVVDGGGDGLRAAGAGDDDDQVFGLTGFEAEVLQHLVDGGLVIVLFVAVAGEDVTVRALGELELVHVARERGLRDVVTLAGEFIAQLFLAGDRSLHQEVSDCAVPIAFQRVLSRTRKA
jgi:hypothetical protein